MAEERPNNSGAGGDGPASPLPTPSLPKGGGAIRGLGEKLAVNPATGTASLTVPIATSPGRSGFGPQLALSYDSGAGNGPFGFGWRMDLPSITRKTDKGLPRYRDDDESDVFILSGAEDLVPVLDDSGARVSRPRTLHGKTYDVRLYRPRIEGLFARIERWTNVETRVSHFRSITRDNVTTLYGFDADSRITSPDDPAAVYAYLICRTFDDKGNLVEYRYIADDARGVDRTQAHEANRSDAVRSTQRYLKEIRYGHATPHFADWSEAGVEPPLPDDPHFRVLFDYGDHVPEAPTPTPDRPWPVRPDPFSTYRAAFEIRTYRRCQRVLMFHSFEQEVEVGLDCLVRSTDLRYHDQDAATDPRNPIYTFLSSVTQSGYRRQDAGYLVRSLPPLELEYSEPVVQADLRVPDEDTLVNLPEGIDGTRYQWVDLDGEGLSGVLADIDGAWSYKRNLSATAARPQFGAARQIAAMPSNTSLASQRLMDLSGDGQLDVVSLDGAAPGFFERTDDRSWVPFRTFASLPALPWSQPNLKVVDLTGDGLADALLTEPGVFTFWPSIGESGFADAERALTPWDEERGPAVVLADGSETIFLADMSGDGLSDIVRVRNGDVCYWPNLGYGRFGAKVAMDGAPRFVDEARFDPRRVRLADIDGSGTTDLVYIADDGVHVAFNRSGNTWAAPQRLAIFPGADNLSSVQVFDLLGNGTACLVWSSPLPGAVAAPLRYVDLMGGEKPHLLKRSRNNLGAETRVRYAPSTRFYLADELAGRPWVTRLPFVVHCVERLETVDFIGRSRFVSRYAYHHGYFDGTERELRGFGMVEQRDTEEHRDDTDFPELEDTNWDATSWSPPTVTKTWFHTGAFLEATNVTKQYAHEYWVEPALRADARAADRAAMEAPDSVIESAASLSAEELREAYRALKGSTLRVEVYGEDGSKRAANPYRVIEESFTVKRLQPQGDNKHAVFLVHPRESLTFQYERKEDDPRVSHAVTLETDPFGNVKRGVTIGYPRRAGYGEPEPTLSASFREMLAYDQTRLHVAATEQRYTSDLTDPALWPDAHRAPMSSTVVEAEWTGIAPVSQRAGITNLFTFSELDAFWKQFADGSHDVAYEDIAASDIDGSGQPAMSPTRRITAQQRTLYRRDDLQGLLPPDQLEPLALAGESYQLALTPGLIARVLEAKITDSELATDGGFVHFNGDPNWWIPSGRISYVPDAAPSATDELKEARSHFYLPRRATDAFGAATIVDYQYDLLPRETVDAVGNTTIADNDFRVLRPFRVTDPNGNRSEIVFDALELVVGTAVMGKVTETVGDSLSATVADLDPALVAAHLADPYGDPAGLLANATSRVVYDLFAYMRTRSAPQPSPNVIYTLVRETHASDLAPAQTTRFQHTFAYCDGSSREIQKKIQAEPGPIVEDGPTVEARWTASGWTILNNKGNPVRKYEPFFTATHQFEFAKQAGVSSVLFYDPIDRVVATTHPNWTWEKVVFGQWQQETWDANDTAMIGDPRMDQDVGDYVRRCIGSASDAWRSWHDRRIHGDFGTTPAQRLAEQQVAKQTQAHAGTPSVVHFDSLGRTCLSVADNAADGRYGTRTARDTRGKPLVIFDALRRRVFEYCKRDALATGAVRYVAGYDLVGKPLHYSGMDGGARTELMNALGAPIRTWDALGRAFRTTYDLLRRITHRSVTIGSSTCLFERTLYGEGMADQNACGRVFRTYDTAGLASHDRYDFKGNLVASTRQLAVAYDSTPDWTPLASLTNPAQLDAAAQPLLVARDRYRSQAFFDALNRVIQVVTPHSDVMNPSAMRPSYNEANLLERIDVWVRLSAAPTKLLEPASATLHAVTDVAYNARGQRTTLALGNDAVTEYAYDPETFRLATVTTTRSNSYSAEERIVQALAYTYDPIGNVTHIQDDADTQDVIYFRNRRVEPSNDYSYDALYRLRTASGREHLGQTGGALDAPTQIDNDDGARQQLHPADGLAMGTYIETYSYDPVGNLLALVHDVATGSWTRKYAYAERSQITTTETNNRLTATSLPGDPDAGPYTARYAHDAHGNMTRMPHLPLMTWDEQDRLRSTSQQVVATGTPETTFYSYDASGERLRKLTNRQALQGQQPRRKQERIYLGALEIFREYASDGTTVELERETLQISDGPRRIALIETRTIGTDRGADKLTRYQHGNHLGSAVLELDDAGEIITYEEYFPYGSTSFQSVRNQDETPKRYRYTGKERDDENALGYHGGRYYAPWLGRWTAPDPTGAADGTNLFQYAASNPVRFVDLNGKQAKTPPQEEQWTWKDSLIDFIRKGEHREEFEERKQRRLERRQYLEEHGGQEPPATIKQAPPEDFEPKPRIRDRHITPEEWDQKNREFHFFRVVPKEERYRGIYHGKPLYGLTGEEAFVASVEVGLAVEGFFRPGPSVRELVEQAAREAPGTTIWARSYGGGELTQVTIKGPIKQTYDLALRLEGEGVLVRVGKSGRNFGQHAERLGRAADVSARLKLRLRPDGPAWMSQTACGPACAKAANVTDTQIATPDVLPTAPGAASATAAGGLQLQLHLKRH